MIYSFKELSVDCCLFVVLLGILLLHLFLHIHHYHHQLLPSLLLCINLLLFIIELIDFFDVRLDNYATMSTNLKQLKQVVYRLTATLGITSIASFLRLGMCILQIYSVKGHQHIFTVSFRSSISSLLPF